MNVVIFRRAQDHNKGKGKVSRARAPGGVELRRNAKMG